MKVIDLSAVRTAYQFITDHPALILVGSGLYGVVFALQSLFTAYAGAYAPGAAPTALVFALLAFLVFIVVIAGFGRAALDKPSKGFQGFTVSGDEGRLAWVVVLVLILLFTVLGTALIALSFMLAALALINVDASEAPPEGFVNIFALFGPGELAVAGALIAVFIAFSAWFGLRLALAVPATLSYCQIKILSIWPLSTKRSFEIAFTVIAAIAPGMAILLAFNILSVSVAGAGPAMAQSASGELGALTVHPAVLCMIYLIYGMGKIALLAAPALSALTSLFMKYSSQTPLPTE